MPDHPFSVTPRRAALVTLQLVALQLGFGLVIGLAGVIVNVARGVPLAAASGVDPLFLGLGNLAAFALILRRELRRSQIGWPALGVWRVDPVALLLPFALMLLGSIALISEAENFLRVVLPAPIWLRQFFSEVTDLGAHPVGSFSCIVIIAPLTEELLFRGLLLRGLLATTTPSRAIAISAALFAAMHLNPWQVPVALAYGVLMGWVYLRTRSLTLCIAGHAFNNATSLLAAGLPFSIRGFNVEHPPGITLFQPVWFDLLGLVLIAAGILFFRRFAPALPPPAFAAEPPLLASAPTPQTSPGPCSPEKEEGLTL